MITRRRAIKHIGAGAAAAATLPRLLGGCGGGGDGGSDGGPPDGGGTDGPVIVPGMSVLVCVCMENRSYDHYFGARKLLEGLPGDGLVAGMSNLDMAGTAVEIFHGDQPTQSCIVDPPHGWDASHAQWNMGLNDGFVTQYQLESGMGVGPGVMEYWTRNELPFSYALADAFTSCDRWFSSLMGPTWPNRMYLHSAQSGGLTANDLPTDQHFMWPSIYGALNAKGVPWRYYFSNLPFVPLFGDIGTEMNTYRIDRFYRDAELGRLPPFVMIDPEFYVNDDHPPTHPILGQQFLASVYAALAASPQWENILLVVTYDEHGGFFDHVSPPTAPDERAVDGFGQLGFRVPAMLAGPYVKEGAVSSVVLDHTSVLKQAETMFGLPPLTMRDAAANDLMDAIDMTRLAALDPRTAPMMPPVMVDESQITSMCTMGKRAPTELEQLADRGYFPPEWDLRKEQTDTLFMIAEECEKLGVGGVRRGR